MTENAKEPVLSRSEAVRLYLDLRRRGVESIAKRAGVSRQTLHNWAKSALAKENPPVPSTDKAGSTNPEAGTDVSRDTDSIIARGLPDNQGANND
jgi:DNA-binding XRE family transcriptional regulator